MPAKPNTDKNESMQHVSCYISTTLTPPHTHKHAHTTKAKSTTNNKLALTKTTTTTHSAYKQQPRTTTTPTKHQSNKKMFKQEVNFKISCVFSPPLQNPLYSNLALGLKVCCIISVSTTGTTTPTPTTTTTTTTPTRHRMNCAGCSWEN